MEKKSKKWRQDVRWSVRAITVSLLMLSGASYQVGALEWVGGVLYSAASTAAGGVFNRVATTTASYLEKEKKREDLFNEAIANSRRDDAEKAVRSAFEAIREGLKSHDIHTNAEIAKMIDKNPNVKTYYSAFQTWYIKYRLGFLILDYTDAFQELSDAAYKQIETLVPRVDRITGVNEEKVKSQQVYFSQFLTEIEDGKKNIGAKLYYSYRYDRGGGFMDRWAKHTNTQYERHRKWGVYTFPPLESLRFDVLPYHPSDSIAPEHQIINNVCEAYKITLKILSDQSVICSEEPEKGVELLNTYVRLFKETFKKRKLSICQLSNLVFLEEGKKKRGSVPLEPPLSSSPSRASSLPITPSTSIPIPKRSSKYSSADFVISPSLNMKNGGLVKAEGTPKSHSLSTQAKTKLLEESVEKGLTDSQVIDGEDGEDGADLESHEDIIAAHKHDEDDRQDEEEVDRVEDGKPLEEDSLPYDSSDLNRMFNFNEDDEEESDLISLRDLKDGKSKGDDENSAH